MNQREFDRLVKLVNDCSDACQQYDDATVTHEVTFEPADDVAAAAQELCHFVKGLLTLPGKIEVTR